MEITEEKLYAAFGLKPNEGGKESEVADQTEENENETVEDVNEDETGNEDESPEDTGPEDTGPEEENPEEGEKESEAAEQTPEERRENAARRRQQEQQAAIDAAVQRALEERDARYQQEQENFFKQAGLVNPFNKEPITNMEEFQAWRQEQDNQKIQKELQSGKLTQETLNKLIDRHPAMQAAREAAEQEQRARDQQQEQAFLQDVERQLEEIRKTDPSIKNVSDLMNRPYSQAFYEAVKRGNNFADAYYLATRGQQEQATEEAARQSAVNNLTGKKHLKGTSIGGRAGATVTAEEREMFHLFNPKATDEQIQRYQNRIKKEK